MAKLECKDVLGFVILGLVLMIVICVILSYSLMKKNAQMKQEGSIWTKKQVKFVKDRFEEHLNKKPLQCSERERKKLVGCSVRQVNKKVNFYDLLLHEKEDYVLEAVANCYKSSKCEVSDTGSNKSVSASSVAGLFLKAIPKN